MKLLNWLFGRDKSETKAVNLSPELWAAINGGWGLPTRSGASVSTNSAIQNTAFYRGMLSLAEGQAQLPVELYRYLPSGKGAEPAIDHPLYDVLLHRPNNVQDAFQFFRTTLMHAIGAGNGVSYRNVVNGETRELIPILPENVNIDIDTTFYSPIYDITFEKGGFATVRQEQVLHIAGPSWSHYKGLNPAVVGREALGLAQATEEAHARLHANGSRPSGVLKSDQRLDQTFIDELRARWKEIYSGTQNTGETAVLGLGLSYEKISMTGAETEHLDTRKHQIEEIARLLGIFPIMIGHAGDQSPTFASADAFLEAHVRYSLQPWIKAVRSAIQTQLLSKDERREGYHVRIDTSELLRGSLKDRTEYYKAALGSNSSPGWLDPNEVREDDGWNPRENLDDVMSPLTMSPAGERATQPEATQSSPKETGDETKSSAPRTLYVSRRLLNATEFLRWAKSQGFAKTVDAADLHVTIAFSRSRIDWMQISEPWNDRNDGTMIVPAGGPRIVDKIGPEGCVALKFSSNTLLWRHNTIREAGASWDWSDYQPHITISYDAKDVDLAKVEPFVGELIFGPEIFAELEESTH